MERKSEPTNIEIQSRKRLKYIINTFCDGSQQKLSDLSGVSKASISHYCSGRNIPSNATAEKLCAPFRLNPAWLRGYDAPMRYIDDDGELMHWDLDPDDPLQQLVDLGLTNQEKLNLVWIGKWMHETDPDMQEKIMAILTELFALH